MRRFLFATLLLFTISMTSKVYADNVPGAAASPMMGYGFGSNNNTSNFRFSPLGLLIGDVSIDYDIKVDPNWTIGPELSYLSMSLDEGSSFTSNFNITGYSFGARANWFNNGTFTDGLYVGPSIAYASVAVKTSDVNGNITANASGVVTSCLVGYGWFWQSFNMMLGGGLSLSSVDKITVTDSSGNTTSASTGETGLAAEWSMGWTF